MPLDFVKVQILLILVVICTLNGQHDKEKGEFYFQRGHDFVNHNDYVGALSHFRTACRHFNSSALYWNDVGVTEMRVGEHVKSRKRFIKSISIDPSFQSAVDNLRDITAFLKHRGDVLESSDFVLKRKRFQYRHSALPIPSTDRGAFQQMLDNQRTGGPLSRELRTQLSNPFIIRGWFDVRSVSNAFTLSYLKEHFGQIRADYYPQNMMEESAHPFFLQLHRALEQINAPEEVFNQVDVSEPGTYIQVNLDHESFQSIAKKSGMAAFVPNFLDDSWSRLCFDHTSVREMSLLSLFYRTHHWKMLLIGGEEAGMFAHQDILRTASYQLQIVGEKRWHICPGNMTQYLYKPGQVDLFQPDYARFPKVKHARCFEATAQPGDLVFYPGDYWHQTLNLHTPSIALSGTVVTAADFLYLRDRLREHCSVTHNGSGETHAQQHRQLCAILEDKCFPQWNEMFGVEKRQEDEL